MRITAIASPEGAREANGLGNTVANITAIAVTNGRLPPWIPKYPVRILATLHMAKDTASEVAICSTGSLSPDPDMVVIVSSNNNNKIRVR